MTAPTGQPPLLVAILAAGASRRLGQPKQLVPIDGEPLLRRQCRMAIEAQLGSIAVILGCRAEECAAAIADLPVEQHVNAEWAGGLGTSIRTAAQAAVAANADGLLLLHADQFRLTATDLKTLHAAWIESNRSIACVSAHGDDFSPPVIVPSSCLTDLLNLDGAKGARCVLEKMPAAAVRRVPVPNAFHDLDLPADAATIASRRSP